MPGLLPDLGTAMKSYRASARLPEAEARRLADALLEADEPADAAAAVEQDSGLWLVEGHWPEPPDPAGLRRLAEAVVGRGIEFAIEALDETDWVAESLTTLHPVPAGRFVVHGRHDRRRVPAGAVGIEIEAGLAFGTGHHATTRSCLILLDRLARTRQPRNVLDLGCGSGVLAIAAAKRLRARVLASDIDPDAVAVARDNVRLNGAAPWVTVVAAAGLEHAAIRARAPFDLILANILASPLIALAPALATAVAPGGHLILSGLLERQGPRVLAAYRARGLRPLKRLVLEGWVSLLLRRPD
jgi:ribosomal protein L11 methyltransferase